MFNRQNSGNAGKIFLCFISLLMLSTNLFAQPYPEVTIMDIQYQPDILITGDQPSSYTGDTLTIVGVVMVAPFRDANPDSGTTLIAGAPALILQDTTETDWAGMLVRYPGMPTGNPFGILDTGYVIRVTGVVVEFFKTTEFDLISFEGSNVIGIMQRPQSVPVTLDSLAEVGGRQGKLMAEKWESVFVQVDTVTVTSGGVGQGSYEVLDENNTQVIVGNQSSYIRNATPPTPGSLVRNMVGYIQNRDNIPNTTYANLINPVYPGDVTVSPAPFISNVLRNPLFVGFGDNVTITAQIVDADGDVTSAKLFYRKNMEANVEVSMSDLGGNIWTANIPAQNDSCIMSFFMQATDDSFLTTIHPSDTSRNRYFYLVLDRPITIRDIQYSPFGGGFSGYHNYIVTVNGVVTSDTTDLEGTETGTLLGSQVYMQDGTGPWSGIKIRGTETLSLARGDDITVTGTVGEDFGVTEIYGLDSPSTIVTNSTGNPIPDPEVLLTSTINLLGNGTLSAEQWEAVLIKYVNITVTDGNADGNIGPHVTGNNNFGDILVSDASSSNTRIALQYGTHNYHNFWFAGMDTIPNYVKQGDTFESVTGILWYGFSNYKLFPRKDDDLVGWVTDVESENTLHSQYELFQNYPNPFNPSTTISYYLPKESVVTLNVYNILGQLVNTLVNERQPIGNHKIIFNASNLSSGIYVYKIVSEDFLMVKKMILVK